MTSYLQRFSAWYFSRRALPYWIILFVDCLIVMMMAFGVYFYQHGALSTLQHVREILLLWSVYLLPFIAAYRAFHTYTGVIRYSSFVDLHRVGMAQIVATFVVVSMNLFLPWQLQKELYRISGLVLVGVLSTALIWMVRVAVKTMYDLLFRSRQASRVFIYGVKQGGVSIAKSLRNAHDAKYVLDGFVTSEESYQNAWLMGVRVFKDDEHLVERILDRGVQAILVSPLYADHFRNNVPLVDALLKEGVRIMMMKQAEEWDGKSDLSHKALHEVDVEDLLPREQIEINMEEVGRLLSGKKILITGAAGSIGSEMVRQIAQFDPKELILVDQAETPMHDVRLFMHKYWPGVNTYTIVTSITNRERMEHIFAAARPDFVFHAAAYKHVPMMEDNPAEAIQNNVYGTRIIADLAVKYGTKKFVMISTDKAVNPTNVMGCSKRICEIYVQSLDRAIKAGEVKGVTQFVTTRFGNVLGSNGSVIPLFREQIKNGGPVTVTHPDIIRFFMLIPEACKLVLEAGTMGKGGEIFIFDMGEPVRIADLARRMIRLSNAPNVEIKYTGLRDGEKLYEEVLSDAEVTKPTHHPKIKIADVREYDYATAREQELRLYEASLGFDAMEIVRIMKEIVPEYKSQHSRYEALDK